MRRINIRAGLALGVDMGAFIDVIAEGIKQFGGENYWGYSVCGCVVDVSGTEKIFREEGR